MDSHKHPKIDIPAGDARRHFELNSWFNGQTLARKEALCSIGAVEISRILWLKANSTKVSPPPWTLGHSKEHYCQRCGELIKEGEGTMQDDGKLYVHTMPCKPKHIGIFGTHRA